MLTIADLPPQIVPAVNAFAQGLSSHIRAHREASLEVHEQGVLDAWDGVERVLPGWRALAGSVAEELTAWRRAHPWTTLAEMEAVVFEVGQRLQAQALQQVVPASAAADVAAKPAAERPTCPTCSGRLEPRGRQRRTIRPARQRAPLKVERSYAVRAKCGAGVFPRG